jgi:hypothetical protein
MNTLTAKKDPRRMIDSMYRYTSQEVASHRGNIMSTQLDRVDTTTTLTKAQGKVSKLMTPWPGFPLEDGNV